MSKMSNDPLAPPAMLIGPPNEADYEAVHAAIVASARGRWFLGEYLSRNRHGETDRLATANARVERAPCGDGLPQVLSAVRRDLDEIAAALDRIAALVAARATPGPAAAVERIADIAFVLHERDVERSLCDALDAAMREINEACALNETGAKEAVAWLRELSHRVGNLLASSGLEQGGVPPARGRVAVAGREGQSGGGIEETLAEAEAGCDPASPAPFAIDGQEDEDFAQAVAALAASLPLAGAARQPKSELTVVGRPPDLPAAQAILPPTLSDPLASVRALSEEELLALFR
jgi:hypothetical protein